MPLTQLVYVAYLTLQQPAATKGSCIVYHWPTDDLLMSQRVATLNV